MAPSLQFDPHSLMLVGNKNNIIPVGSNSVPAHDVNNSLVQIMMEMEKPPRYL